MRDPDAIDRRSDGIPSGTPPVKLVIDASSDNRRVAYVALIVDGKVKPRLIYGTGRNVGGGNVESWSVKRALRRTNALYDGLRPVIVYTDNLSQVETRGSVHTQYVWLPRTNRLMRHLHAAANALRKSLSP